MILLMVVFLLVYIVSIVCIMCGLMIEVLYLNFICIVWVKGLLMCRIIFCYVLKFVLLLVLFYMGLVFVGIIIGLMVIEIIYGLLGIGQFFVNGVFNCDYLLVLSLIILVGVLIILFNVIVDVFYVVIDLKICY